VVTFPGVRGLVTALFLLFETDQSGDQSPHSKETFLLSGPKIANLTTLPTRQLF
jgi:hypothetical protein